MSEKHPVLIGAGQLGGVAATPHGPIYSGHSVAEALGKWCYHNREMLGLDIRMMFPGGEFLKAPT